MENIISLIRKGLRSFVWLLRMIAADADVKTSLKKLAKAGLVIAEAVCLTVIFYLWILFVKACLGAGVEGYLRYLEISWFVLISRIVRKKIINIFKK